MYNIRFNYVASTNVGYDYPVIFNMPHLNKFFAWLNNIFLIKTLSNWFKNPKIVCKCIVLNGAMLKKNPNLHFIISKSEDQKS